MKSSELVILVHPILRGKEERDGKKKEKVEGKRKKKKVKTKNRWQNVKMLSDLTDTGSSLGQAANRNCGIMIMSMSHRRARIL